MTRAQRLTQLATETRGKLMKMNLDPNATEDQMFEKVAEAAVQAFDILMEEEDTVLRGDGKFVPRGDIRKESER